MKQHTIFELLQHRAVLHLDSSARILGQARGTWETRSQPGSCQTISHSPVCWAICTIGQQKRLEVKGWCRFELQIQKEVQQRMPASCQ